METQTTRRSTTPWSIALVRRLCTSKVQAERFRDRHMLTVVRIAGAEHVFDDELEAAIAADAQAQWEAQHGTRRDATP